MLFTFFTPIWVKPPQRFHLSVLELLITSFL
jgi:hypothetical protein